jgi:transposase, IS6 family
LSAKRDARAAKRFFRKMLKSPSHSSPRVINVDFIKRRVNPGLGFFSFKTARGTIGGYEVTNMIRKGQVEGIGKGDIRGQVRFVADLFKVAA